MKKSLATLLLLSISCLAMAKPVSVETAKTLAAKFVAANMPDLRNNNVEHIYTLFDNTTTTPYLYVMNYELGFVVVSADDIAKPILAYSTEGRLDPNNIPEGMHYYLDYYRKQIDFAVSNNIPQDEETASEWREIATNGMPMHRDAKTVSPLLATTWDQNSPYNYYCPTTSSYGAPGGKAYAGCVATAMSQIMKFWNHPAQGTGSNTYTINMSGSELNGTQISEDFSTAIYDWNNMPSSLSWSSSTTQRNAVALLMYHAGVSTYMGYSGSGSGTQSSRVPNALKNNFSYSNIVKIVERADYTKTEFEDILIKNLDYSIPVYYSGSDETMGHAFVCDGYDATRKFHFNWGWSSAGDGYFAIDALNPTVWTTTYNFNMYQTAITMIVPDNIASALPLAPDPFVAKAENTTSLNGTVTWTNPTKAWDNTTLTTLSKVVLMREGNIIKTYTSAQPGQEMSFNDNVPAYGIYEYSVYAETTAGKGYVATTKAIYGASCEWRFMCSSNSAQGWPNGGLKVFNASNEVVAELTLNTSGLKSEYLPLPEGNLTIKWTAPNPAVSVVTILIQNEAGQTMASYANVNSTTIPEVIYEGNNACTACTAPVNLEAELTIQDGQQGAKLTWDRGGDSNPSKYYIYTSTNGSDYTKLAEVSGSIKTYFDPVSDGEHYYKVTAKYLSCESDYASSTDGSNYVYVIADDGIDEQNNIINISPNPANDKLYVSGEKIESINVYNMTGQLVKKLQCNSDEVVVELSGLQQGLYMISVKASNSETVRRITVLH